MRIELAEIVKSPEPPYNAVIFTSHRTGGDHGYGEKAARMLELAPTFSPVDNP